MKVLLVGEALFFLLGLVAVAYVVNNFFRVRKLKRIIFTQQKQILELRDDKEIMTTKIFNLSREVETQKILAADRTAPVKNEFHN